MIRVCLIDDQTLVRQGIKSLLGLADSIDVIGEAADGQAGLELIAQKQPDVVLLDLRMPVLDGLGVLKALQTASYSPPTLILTTFDDDNLVLEGLKAGAKGYLLKDVSLEQLVNAIQTLHEGKTLIQPAITERLLRGLRTLDNPVTAFETPEPLTERETEILRLMAGGYSNKEIASALDLTEGTVKNHVSNVLSKMGVRDRTRAVLKGLESGII
ncbi:MAG: response regulator transcription factor [Trueperaceae bacterium]|nr:response regulator transcription factor [Trueperaceae bacterium]